MTDEQIVEAAKFAEKKTEFGKLVHSQVSRGVNSAYGIGFLEGAEWAKEQMTKDAVEGEYGYFSNATKTILPSGKLNLKEGDKVRIIIVKEN